MNQEKMDRGILEEVHRDLLNPLAWSLGPWADFSDVGMADSTDSTDSTEESTNVNFKCVLREKKATEGASP